MTAQEIESVKHVAILEQTSKANRPAPPSTAVVPDEVCEVRKLLYGRASELIGAPQRATQRQHIDLVCAQQPRIDLLGRALALEIEQERLAPEPLDRASVQLVQRRSLHQDSVLEQSDRARPR